MAFEREIQQASKKWGVPEEEIRAIIGAESSYNPNAVSPKGAQGTMQIMPETGKWLHSKYGGGGEYDPFNPAQNIDYGTGYYAELKSKYGGDRTKALSAYNMGPGAFDKRGGKPYKETQQYVDKVTSSLKDKALKSIVGKEILSSGGGAAFESSFPSIAEIGDLSAPSFAYGAEGGGTGFSLMGGEEAASAYADAALSEGAVPWSAGPLGAAAGVVGVADIASRWGQGKRDIKSVGLNTAEGAASGAAIGSYIAPGPGTAIGAGIGAIYGAAGSLIKTGKHKDQIARDSVREALKSGGIIDDNYGLELADGRAFNIGLDGGATFQNVGQNIDGKSERHAYDVDFSNPTSEQAVGWANPLAAIITNGDKKLQSDFAGYFVNAAQSTGNNLESIRSNIMKTFEKMGLDNDGAINILRGLKDAGRINQHEMDSYVYGLGTLTSGNFKTEAPQTNFVTLPSEKSPPLKTPNPGSISSLPIVYDEKGVGRYSNPGGMAPLVAFVKPGSSAASSLESFFGPSGLSEVGKRAATKAM